MEHKELIAPLHLIIIGQYCNIHAYTSAIRLYSSLVTLGKAGLQLQGGRGHGGGTLALQSWRLQANLTLTSDTFTLFLRILELVSLPRASVASYRLSFGTLSAQEREPDIYNGIILQQDCSKASVICSLSPASDVLSTENPRPSKHHSLTTTALHSSILSECVCTTE